MGREECESFSYLSEHLVTVKFFYCLSRFFLHFLNIPVLGRLLIFVKMRAKPRKIKGVLKRGTDNSISSVLPELWTRMWCILKPEKQFVSCAGLGGILWNNQSSMEPVVFLRWPPEIRRWFECVSIWQPTSCSGKRPFFLYSWRSMTVCNILI